VFFVVNLSVSRWSGGFKLSRHRIDFGFDIDTDMSYNILMKLKRGILKKLSTKEVIQERPIELSAGQSISFVWDLTREVYSLSGKYDVESRLQRDVVNIIRGKG